MSRAATIGRCGAHLFDGMVVGMSFYLGPLHPRLSADTWAELGAASQAGVFDETAWVEAKEAIPASSKAANLELAKDLASLAVDGGTLVVGLEDTTAKVVGTTDDYESLRTRIIQVAASRIAPPLHVGIRRIESLGDPSRYVLLASVPASASAPHMVDDRYWGRTSEGKRPLSDAEIGRLFTERRGRDALGSRDLDALATRLDPYRSERNSSHGHVHAILRPRGQVSTTIQAALGGRYLPQVVLEIMQSRPHWPPFRDGFAHTRPFSDGTLLALDERDEMWRDAEQFLYRLLVRDDGGLQFVSGAGTRNVPLHRGTEQDEGVFVSAGQQLEMLHCLIVLAAGIAANHLAYWGEWEIGYRIDRLKNVAAMDTLQDGNYHGRLHPYPDEEFLCLVMTTTQEMLDSPEGVVQRTLGPLMRSLGTTHYLPYSHLNDIYKRAGN